MPKQINTAGPGSRLVQLFGLKGRFQPVLDEVIVPVVSVDPESVETRLAQAEGEQGAVAGEYGFCEIRNPAGSGILVTVTRIITSLYTSSGTWWMIVPSYLTATAAMTKAWRQSGNVGTPAAEVGVGTTAVDSSSVASWRMLGAGAANTMLDTNIHIELAEGDGMLFQFGTVNIGVAAAFEWEEQPLNVTNQ